MNHSCPNAIRRYGCFLILLIMGAAAHGAVDTWISTTSGTWSKKDNWSGDVPNSASSVIFNCSAGLETAITLSAKSSSNSLVFNAAGGANAYTFDTAQTVNAHTLTLTSGITNSAAATQTFYNTFRLAGNQTWNAGSGALVFNGEINLGSRASSYALTINGSNAVTMSGVIANGGTAAGSLTYAGTGTLTLSGTTANSYTGATQINNGTIQLNKTAGTNAIGGSTVTIGDGIGAANSASLTLLAANQIADYAGLITVNSDGQLNLNNQSESINTLAGTGAIAFGPTGYLGVGVNSGSSTFGGSLTGTGVLEKVGSGTLTFDSSFNFSGELRITSGTVVLAGITATVGTLHITGNTILDFGNSSASTLNATTLIIDAGVTLTITNWVNAVDYFYAQNFNRATLDTRGGTPTNQITFTGYSNNNTGWLSYDHQVTPAPEPATYGALFVALCLGLIGLRRRRQKA